MMKKKILAGLAALAVVAGFSAFAATPAASETPSSAPYEQGYTCYDNGYCPGPQRHGCYDGQNNCYTDNGYCQGLPGQYPQRLSGLAGLPGLW